MDIARPDLKQKKKKERQRRVGIGVAAILAATVLFLVRFEEAPHHREYVTLKRGSRAIETLVVLPKSKNKAPVVILVHEIYGLSGWAKGMADELADQGFIVVAPDLLSGHGPNGGGYSDFGGDEDRVRGAISSLDPDAVLADMDAAADFGRKLPLANGKIAVVGFSWGGWKSFAFATHRRDLAAVFVFYGTGPEDVTAINAPVYGFYAGEDAGVDVTIAATIAQMKAANKFYDPVTYEGAEHGFMRLGEDSNNKVPANKIAHDQAFSRLVKLLKEMKPTAEAAH